MSYLKSLKRPDELTPKIVPNHALPVDRPVAIYYRQSTLAQYGNASTNMQLVDLPEYVQRLGWSKDNVVIVDEDAGVSGSKKISERNGMKRLFEMIVNGQLGAVACQDEDRLFRDLTQIQVNIFIEACQQAGVRVITPNTIYDFQGPAGIYHARQFRFRSEVAADYLQFFIHGRLLAAKSYMSRQGRWTGGRVTMGYLVDTRKTLPDGTQNPDWYKLSPFPPYAAVVRAYFQVLVDCHFAISVAVRQIARHGPYLPDPATSEIFESVPRGFTFTPPQTSSRKRGLYYPQERSLRYLATNVHYIGHWLWNQQIVRWHNHPAIVPEDLFMSVFNHFCETDLHGNPNPHYSPLTKLVFPLSNEHLKKPRPVFENFLVSDLDGTRRSLSVVWVKRIQGYRYIILREGRDEWKRGKCTSTMDSILSAALLLKLEATLESGNWQAVRGKQVPLWVHELELLLDCVPPPNASRLLISLTYRLRRLITIIVDRWEQFDRSTRRRIIHELIREIVVTPVTGKPTIVHMYWRDGEHDALAIPHRIGKFSAWLQSELDLLDAMTSAHKPELEIAAQFPYLRWQNIIAAMRARGMDRSPHQGSLSYKETFVDYLNRVRTQPPDRQFWSERDLTRLGDLMNSNVTSLEIAAAFPSRSWRGIQSTARRVFRRCPVHDETYRGTEDETILMYFSRIGSAVRIVSGVPIAYPKSRVSLPYHARLHEKAKALNLIELVCR